MGRITSTLAMAQRQLHVTQVCGRPLCAAHGRRGQTSDAGCCCLQMIAELLEAPGNLTWSQPATWAGTAVGISKQVHVNTADVNNTGPSC